MSLWEKVVENLHKWIGEVIVGIVTMFSLSIEYDPVIAGLGLGVIGAIAGVERFFEWRLNRSTE